LGEGPTGATIAFVAEQPGDQEDREGRPFVGPAGQLLNRALSEADMTRERVYVTNAANRFKFEQCGRRRIHERPTTGEVKHYCWSLFKELECVRRPEAYLALLHIARGYFLFHRNTLDADVKG
jgi:uracil-DNA glycosylase family 4